MHSDMEISASQLQKITQIIRAQNGVNSTMILSSRIGGFQLNCGSY